MKIKNSNNAEHLIVISIDALSSNDLSYLKTLPNFKNILEKASYAKEVESIYPTLTYPCHTTIVTGNYPNKHGIYNNTKLQVGKEKPDWYWYVDDVKCPTLYSKAREAGLKVGAIFWPVMAGAKINYNLAEIWPNDDKSNQTSLSLKTGSKLFILSAFLRYKYLLDGLKQPNLDNFTTKAASYMIKSRKPNLALFHLIDVDDARHHHGINSPEAYEALKRQDNRIGEIIQATKDAGIYENTTFILLGDHSFVDIQYKINLNVLFRQHGLLEIDSNGNIVDWKAYCHAGEGSAQIALKKPDDEKVKKEVETLLYSLEKDKNSGIEKIYSKEEAFNKGVSGIFDYMVEPKKGYCIKLDWTSEKVVEKLDYEKGEYYGTHGFDPLKYDYSTLFIAFGKGIKENVIIPKIKLVDEGPTMAKILGLELKNTDGRVIQEIIDNS